MKRWFFLAAVTVVLPVIALACGDDTSGAAATADAGANPTSTTTNTTPTSTATTPDDGGTEAGPRRGCLDRPTDVERPDRLPCNLIPPGLTL